MATLSESVLNIHLSLEKTSARHGSGFLVEKNTTNDVKKPRSPVVGASFVNAMTSPLPQPTLVCISPQALELIQEKTVNLPSSIKKLPKEASDELATLISGTKPQEGYAQCYAGHQFGHFSGQLGDGAAILLGGTGKYEAQLKGAGLTSFSRTADGRKVLRSTLREFLASEHMHALNIPTTRAGGIAVSSSETVVRDMFYNGNARHEPCANVLRIAQTFIRFGSFEIFKPIDDITGRAGPSAELPEQVKSDMLRSMLSFVMREYYDINDAEDFEAAVFKFLEAVVARTATLVSKWQTVGFCHGVLNTDNMSIIGDTLDYGPYGFMEHFDPKHICNTSDDSGRYAYLNQPEICKWNCHVLVKQFELLFDDDAIERMHMTINETYDRVYKHELKQTMEKKLGLIHGNEENDRIIDSFWSTLTETHADFTCTFRALARISSQQDTSNLESILQELVAFSHTLEQAQRVAQPIVSPTQLAHLRQLLVSKPEVALRYGITAEIVEEHAKELRDFAAFLESDNTPESYKSMQENKWRLWLHDYEVVLRNQGVDDQLRAASMNAVNPKYILRNHVAQSAINAASEGDYVTVEHIFHLLTHPFDDGKSCDAQLYAGPLDPTAPPLLVSCSS